MTLVTKFEISSRVFSISKVAGNWQAGGGVVTGISISVPLSGAASVTYTIDADVGPDVTRKELLVSYTLAEAQALAADLNA